jgi:hypothetical protein
MRPIRRTSQAILLSLVLPAAVAAGPAPVGPAFKVMTCTGCTLTNPGIAGTPSGRFLTAFNSQPSFGTSIAQTRSFRPTAIPFGAPTPVVSTDGLPQYDAAVAGNNTGVGVVVWSVVNAPTQNSDIRAQRLDATGKAVGPVLAVNVDPTNAVAQDTLPSVAMGSDGAFTVAWIRQIPYLQPIPETGFQVWARRYGPTGTPLGPPRMVSNGLVEGFRPSACIDSSQRTVISWTSDGAAGLFQAAPEGVSIRRLSPVGVPLATPLAVAPPKAGHTHTAVSCGLGGGFVVAWETDQPPAGGDTDVVARIFNGSAVAQGPIFVVNTARTGDQRLPSVAHDAAGNFVVVFKDLADGHTGVYGQRYSATGVAQGTEFKVAAISINHAFTTPPRLAMAGAGNAFVVVWDDNAGLIGQRFKIVP